MTTFSRPLILPVLTSAALPVAGTLAALLFLPEWRLAHEPLHALIELAGAAFALAIIFLIYTSHAVRGHIHPGTMSWIALALISMALLDAAHALAPVGPSFVWLHSLAVFVGGLLFAGVWLSSKYAVPPAVVILFAVASTLVGVGAHVYPASVPTMLENGQFSGLAHFLNLTGGAGFLAAALYFLRSPQAKRSRAMQLLAAHCLLFGVAGLLFEASALWDAAWWWWHILRMGAYAVLFGVFVDIVVLADKDGRWIYRLDTEAAQRIGAMIAGIVCLVVGMLVMAGWVTDSTRIVQLHPGFAPMQFNTALCFALCGFAVLCLRTVPRWALVPATIVLFISSVTAIQYIFGIDTGLDRLFVAPDIMTRTSHAGRMSPMTCLCFVLVSLSVIANRKRLEASYAAYVPDFLALAAFVIAAAAVIGYVTQFQEAFGWFHLMGMALHTAAGFLILSSALLWLAWDPSRKERLPLGLTGAMFGCAFIFDLYTPAAVAGGIVYVPLMFLSVVFRSPKAPFHTAALVCVLAVLGHVLSPPGEDTYSLSAVNRIIEILCVWSLAFFLYMNRLNADALAASEERFDLAVRGSSVGLWDLDTRNSELYWSPRFKEIVGVRDEDFVPHLNEFSERLHPEDKDRVLNALESHIADGTTYDVEYRLRREDMSYVWIHARGQAIWDREGRALRMAGSVDDITSRKMAEIKSRERLELLLLAEQVAGAGNWLVDLEENTVLWSDEVYRIHGVDPSTFVPDLQTGIEFYHPDDRPRVREYMERAIHRNEPFEFNLRIVRPDGDVRHVASKGICRTNAAGEVRQIFGIFQDRTDAVQAELELRASEKRFATAVEGLSVGVWDWIDVRKESEWWSQHFYRLLGYRPFEIEASLSNFRALLHPDDMDATFRAVDTHFERNEPFHIEYRLKHKTDGYKWFLGTGQVMRDETGAPQRMIGSIMDIDGRKQAEAEREKLLTELKRSNEELDDFAHIASHDLKEPLRAISNHAKMLQRSLGEAASEDTRKRLDRLTALSNRMDGLISDLLYFSRLGRQDLAWSDTDLNEVLAKIEDTLHDHMTEKNARIDVPHPLPAVYCDRVRVKELFRNLITNGIKYNLNNEKRIEIGSRDIDGRPVFYVKDNGIGIPNRHHEDIFRIFKRLHGDKKFKFEGTGSGLTFVKKIVEGHGGRIWLESDEGAGTTFYFTLEKGRST